MSIWVILILVLPIILLILWISTGVIVPKKNELEVANQKIGELSEQLRSITEVSAFGAMQLEKLQSEFKHLQHQKISGDVRLGQKYEQILPFLQDFPYKEDEIKGLFSPIDLIVFREDSIVFVEVKTGSSQLSDKQRKIRDIIRAGKVSFEVHRMDEKGITIK